jgi:hypothetical protein
MNPSRQSTDAPATEQETSAAAGASGSRPPARRRRGHVAIGTIQMGALLGVVGLAVVAGAILVDNTSVPGWIDGLAIGAGSVILTLLVVFNGARARRIHRGG